MWPWKARLDMLREDVLEVPTFDHQPQKLSKTDGTSMTEKRDALLTTPQYYLDGHTNYIYIIQLQSGDRTRLWFATIARISLLRAVTIDDKHIRTDSPLTEWDNHARRFYMTWLGALIFSDTPHIFSTRDTYATCCWHFMNKVPQNHSENCEEPWCIQELLEGHFIHGVYKWKKCCRKAANGWGFSSNFLSPLKPCTSLINWHSYWAR